MSIANEADSIGQTLGEKIALSIRQAYDQYSSELRATATVTATVEGIKILKGSLILCLMTMNYTYHWKTKD